MEHFRTACHTSVATTRGLKLPIQCRQRKNSCMEPWVQLPYQNSTSNRKTQKLIQRNFLQITVFLMLSYIQVSVLSCPCYFFKFGKSLLHFSWLQLSLRHLPSEAVFSRGCLLCCYCSGSAFVWFYLMVE